MTDNEIIKALECIKGEYVVYCKECAYGSKGYLKCKNELAKDAIDLINRQKAEIEQYKDYNAKWMKKCEEQKVEIERLENEVFAKEQEYVDMQEQRDSVEKHLETAKAEAIKEFAERLKKDLRTGNVIMDKSIADIIDNLVKEMTEQRKEDEGK